MAGQLNPYACEFKPPGLASNDPPPKQSQPAGGLSKALNFKGGKGAGATAATGVPTNAAATQPQAAAPQNATANGPPAASWSRIAAASNGKPAANGTTGGPQPANNVRQPRAPLHMPQGPAAWEAAPPPSTWGKGSRAVAAPPPPAPAPHAGGMRPKGLAPAPAPAPPPVHWPALNEKAQPPPPTAPAARAPLHVPSPSAAAPPPPSKPTAARTAPAAAPAANGRAAHPAAAMAAPKSTSRSGSSPFGTPEAQLAHLPETDTQPAAATGTGKKPPARKTSPLSKALDEAAAKAAAAAACAPARPQAAPPPKAAARATPAPAPAAVTVPPAAPTGTSPSRTPTSPLTPSQPIAIRSRGSRQQLTMDKVEELEEEREREERHAERRRVRDQQEQQQQQKAKGAGGGVEHARSGGEELSVAFEDGFETASCASSTASRGPSLSQSCSLGLTLSAEQAAQQQQQDPNPSAARPQGGSGDLGDATPTLLNGGISPALSGAAAAAVAAAAAAAMDAGEAETLRASQDEMNADGPVSCPSLLRHPDSIAADAGAPAPAPVQVPMRVGPADFEMLRVVGQGAFGKVFQVMHKETRVIYAMKVMRKERILQRDHSEYVRSERDLLTAVVHPYIVQLRFSFQSPTKLYLVLDFLNGGHLFFNLYRQGVFSEDVARLYTAEIVSAIAYLHSRGIVHRDLKPENVLLDSDGHVRLTDFGLAKGNMCGEGDRTNSFIGTMEYMAPEIIDAKGHGKTVDWWSTGILLYEMLCGVPPFRAKSRQALQQQITTGKVKYPKFLSNDAQNLLRALLTRDASRRLGAGPDGSEAIKRHAFFKQISWSKLEARQIESKFKPAVTCCMDVGNFDKIWTDQPAVDSPCGTPTHASLGKFEGFSYVAPSMLAHVHSQGLLHLPTPAGVAGGAHL